MNGLDDRVSSPTELNWAIGHSATHINTIITEPAMADSRSPMPSMTATPIATNPSMNSRSAHQAPAMLLKALSNGPTLTPDRKPLVGDPPASQARSLAVENPRPNSLSRKAHRKTKPTDSRRAAIATLPVGVILMV